jgi:hypothetical protein
MLSCKKSVYFYKNYHKCLRLSSIKYEAQEGLISELSLMTIMHRHRPLVILESNTVM